MAIAHRRDADRQSADVSAGIRPNGSVRAAPDTGRRASATVCAPTGGGFDAEARAHGLDGSFGPVSVDDAPVPDAWAIEQLGVRLRGASQLFTTRVARAAQGIVKLGAWKYYGFARLSDYADLKHQRSARWFQDWAKLGEGLERFPALEAAVLGRDGRPVGAVAATEIARVATRETVASWIERARQVTVRELKEEIRARRAIGETAPGSHPGEPGAQHAPDESAQPNEDTPREHNTGEPVPWGTAASRTTLDEEDPDIEPRVLVGFEVPRKVMLAFEDGLDLHRAVTGSEATVESFLEALAAERAAGLAPPDCLLEPLQCGDRTARIEHALARVNRRWAQLFARDADAGSVPNDAAGADVAANPRPQTARGRRAARSNARGSAARGRDPFPVWDTRAAVGILAREAIALQRDAEAVLAKLEADPGPSEYPSAFAEAQARHDELAQLLPIEDAIERCLARLMDLMRTRGDFATLGFASLGHHAVERLGLPRRTAESRAGILHALRNLPRICEAYETGAIRLTAAWTLHGILRSERPDATVEDQWIEHARHVNVKRLKEEARALHRQALMTPEAPDPRLVPASRPCPLPATDAEWLASLRRAPGDTRNRLRALELPGVDDPCATLADLQRTDTRMRFRVSVEIGNAFRGALEASRRRLTGVARARIDADQSREPRAPASLRAAQAFTERERRVTTGAALLALLEDYAETHDNPEGFPVRRWDPVYCQWGWVCRVPGCTVRVGTEDHHLIYRSRNGSDEIHNQILLCAFHHRQGEHGDFMRCWGTAPGNIHWMIGAPEVAVHYFNERRIDPA